jgi:DNA-binding NtrC family response regulator
LAAADGTGIELLYPKRDPALFPVVLMTSHGNEELAVGAMKAGAWTYCEIRYLCQYA